MTYAQIATRAIFAAAKTLRSNLMTIFCGLAQVPQFDRGEKFFSQREE